MTMSGQDRASRAKKPVKFDLRLSEDELDRLKWLVMPENDPTARGGTCSELLRRLIAEEHARRLKLLAKHRTSVIAEQVTARMTAQVAEAVAGDEFIELP